MRRRGNETTMPAKKESFMESMKVSVGLRADMSLRFPRLSISALGRDGMLRSAWTWVLSSARSSRDLRKSARCSSGRRRTAR